jgi:hypothetical protein
MMSSAQKGPEKGRDFRKKSRQTIQRYQKRYFQKYGLKLVFPSDLTWISQFCYKEIKDLALNILKFSLVSVVSFENQNRNKQELESTYLTRWTGTGQILKIGDFSQADYGQGFNLAATDTGARSWDSWVGPLFSKTFLIEGVSSCLALKIFDSCRIREHKNQGANSN